jgi:pimeloyl-ACP methyl ester carboxylesterase
MRRCWLLMMVVMAVLLAGMPAVQAATHVARVPLREGKLHTDDLVAALAEHVGLEVDCPISGRIDLSSLKGSLFVRAMNKSLGDGCRLSVEADALVLQFDPEKLPKNARQTKKAIRVFTAVAAPGASADQARMYGLLLPNDLDATRPLVVLVHGLDCSKGQWWAMAERLQQSGFQVGYFTFPSDQPLVDSSELFGQHLSALREMHPQLPVSVLTYSMGGLVARGYIEGPDYGGEVGRLIMLAPPNHGSKWARYRAVLEVEEHWNLYRTNDDWKWTWPITDGLGEAGSDLRPDSMFLDELNTLPRRQGVQYTIIAGNQHPARRLTANCIEAPSRWIPSGARSWWGVRHTRSFLKDSAADLRAGKDKSDGPVTIRSARLDGVEDFVLLPADHSTLMSATRSQPPIAWETVHSRLTQ